MDKPDSFKLIDVLTGVRGHFPSFDIRESNKNYIIAISIIVFISVFASNNVNVEIWTRSSVVLFPNNSVYNWVVNEGQLGVETAYPYLPHYAFYTGLLVWPIWLIGWLVPNFPKYPSFIWDVGQIPIYFGFMSAIIAGASFVSDKDKQLKMILLLSTLPVFYTDVTGAGSDMVMTGLVVLCAYSLTRGYWFVAGLFLSLSTFKFLTIPLAVSIWISTYFITNSSFKKYTLGGFVGQLPNIIYFIAFPDDLLLLLRNRGAVSKSGTELNFSKTILDFINAGQYPDLYINIILPIVLLLSILLAIYLFVNGNLFQSFIISLFPMIYLSPAELRPEPIFAIFFILLILSERKLSSYLAFAAWLLLLITHIPTKQGGQETDAIHQILFNITVSSPVILILIALSVVLTYNSTSFEYYVK